MGILESSINNDKSDDSLYITDLLEVETLQKIQDTFSRMTGMSAITIDAEGNLITEPSAFTGYCMKYTRASKIGSDRCRNCNLDGARLSLEAGMAVTHKCHAGLINFSAPILADGKMVGSIAAGQISTEPLDDDFVRKYARELEINPAEYLNASYVIPIVDEMELNRSAEFLYSISDIFSELAYHKYLAIKAGVEIQRAADMKGDFVANMSHEIRTPMNAVIGMAEMALRENLPDRARDYINQIKTSGSSLLTIINDVLDFSKIEAGKMDIVWVEYEPLTLINDVVSIIKTRVKDKQIELIVDVDKNLPRMLFGDENRIKQVIINLLNNAAKFTKVGKVVFSVSCDEVKERQTTLRVSVEDTGIGIKKEDMSKLFQSFQQLDSKRNRNIEGNGLGLAISAKLLSLMNGSPINVESEYEKGSTFSFSLPQMVLNEEKNLVIRDVSDCVIVDMIGNIHIAEQLRKDAQALGVRVVKPLTQDEMDELCKETDIRIFYFLEKDSFNEVTRRYILSHPMVHVNVLVPYDDSDSYDDIPNVIAVKKPLYILNLSRILMEEELIHVDYSNSGSADYDFIAPDATVLIVDDNQVNLTVSAGLLEPLQMHIDMASSGQEAISLVQKKHYDLIFMDHMMPEMDGVEATHLIRRIPDYNDVPIIALTGNVMDDMRRMFLTEGMNDFVAKPIELRVLIGKVKQWLNPCKIIKSLVDPEAMERDKPIDNLKIGDLDTENAIKMVGNESLYMTILEGYYNMIDQKAALIRTLLETEDLQSYTIEVHALKSSSRQIGAGGLSDMAFELEKAGNAGDWAYIKDHTGELLDCYLGYKEVLAQVFPKDDPGDAELKEPVVKDIAKLFDNMIIACDELDMDCMEDVVDGLSEYRFEGIELDHLNSLKDAVRNMDVDAVEDIIKKWSVILNV